MNQYGWEVFLLLFSGSLHMSDPVRIILVSDSAEATAVEQELSRGGLHSTLERVASLQEMKLALRQSAKDLVIASDSTAGFSVDAGMQVLEELNLDIPMIVVSNAASAENIVAAIHSGARNYVTFDHLSRLTTAAESALTDTQRQREKSLAEKTLQQSHLPYQDLVQTIEGIVWEVRLPSFQFLFISQQAERLLGYPIEQWLKEPDFWQNHIHPDDREWAVNFCIQSSQEMRDHEFEYRMIAADGRTLWLRDLVTVVVEENRPVRLRGIMIDITDKKKAEERLLLLESAVQQAHESILITTADLESSGPKIVFVNHAFTLMTGYSSEEVLGRSPQILLGTRTNAETQEGWNEQLSRGEYYSGETVNYRKDGSQYIVEWQVAPVRNQHGTVTHFVSIQRDISERKKVEEKLQEREQQYRILVEHAPEAIVVLDADTGRFVDVNENATKLWGLSKEEMLKYGPIELSTATQPDGRLSMEVGTERIKEALEGAAPVFEWTHRNVAGDSFLCEVRLVRLPEAGRNLVRGSVTDISKRKQAEEELKNLQQQLLHMQKMEAIGQLAGGIAHDFNNILMGITSYCELILMKLPEADAIAQDIRTIYRVADHGSSLTRHLLAFSRRQVLEPKVLDMNSVLSTMEKLIQRLLGEDIQLTLMIEKHLGRVKADPTQMEQIIVNLAVNARDAMPEGGELIIRTANIELNEKYSSEHLGVVAGNYVLLSVSDTGHGMEESVISHIFEPFFTTKEQGKGTGLGLSTVYGIVKQSGGHITVHSRPNEGTAFEVFLPRIEMMPGEIAAVAELRNVIAGNETILLVDDNEQVKSALGAILGMRGYKVLQAENGPKALELAENYSGNIDLLVTDMVMPNMNGRELAEILSSQRPQLKVIYMSGFTEDFVLRQGVTKGTAFLRKPASAADLLQKVREMLDSHSV